MAATHPRHAANAAAADLADARERTLALVAGLSDADVETAHSALMSPLVWDLAHIAAYEDLWIACRHGGGDLLQPELAAMYDAFETPRAVRGDLHRFKAYVELDKDRKPGHRKTIADGKVKRSPSGKRSSSRGSRNGSGAGNGSRARSRSGS